MNLMFTEPKVLPSKIKEVTGFGHEWTNIILSKSFTHADRVAQILMGHYLMVLFQEGFLVRPPLQTNPPVPVEKPLRYVVQASLLAFDLQDHSIQEVNLNKDLFGDQKEATFIKYQDNQILKFGDYRKETEAFRTFVRITVESFQPFSIKCEEVRTSGEYPKFQGHVAQINNNFLHVYCEANDSENDLWSLDLRTLTWQAKRSSGEKPCPRDNRSSFIFQDHLYIYGGKTVDENDIDTKDFFMLNLNTMIWTKIAQKETLDAQYNKQIGGGALYKDHLLTLQDQKSHGKLYCWNITTNSWSNFDIQRSKFEDKTGYMGVYNNFLLCSGDTGSGSIVISTLNLDHIACFEPPEQKQRRSLFMNEKESDIKFKIQDKIVPAHKRILIEKSKYFANLFNSGMAETRQGIIEIPDCDDLTFQEFLRFLYCNEVHVDDIKLALKLLFFTDKYVQNDLHEQCIGHLKSHANTKNILTIFDSAREENDDHISSWCLDYVKNTQKDQNLSGLFDLVEYLNKPNNPEFVQEDLELRDEAIKAISKTFSEYFRRTYKISNTDALIDHESNQTFYEDFLIKNIAFDTVVPLVKFISGHSIHMELFEAARPEEKIKNEKERLEPLTMNLRTALYAFTQKNLKQLEQNKILKQFPNDFLADLLKNTRLQKMKKDVPVNSYNLQ